MMLEKPPPSTGTNDTISPQPPETQALLGALCRHFVSRWDWYALQQPDGSYRAFHRPLRRSHLIRHLKGELTLGVYALDKKSCARWVCFDADEPAGWSGLLAVHERLRTQSLPSYVEPSRRGGHLWLFFAEPLSGRTVRAFARALVHDQPPVELFPKQDRLTTGPSSLVRLPLGVHRRDGQRYGFGASLEQATTCSFQEQVALIEAVATVPTASVAAVLAEVALQQRSASSNTHRAALERGRMRGKSLVETIKREIDIYAFIAGHVELTASGRSHCPFHDDAHKSFSVNREGGFFHCFAGHGGGDVIAFWQKYRGISAKQAIHELAGHPPSTPARLATLPIRRQRDRAP